MTSYRYNTYKFEYYSDDGDIYIKRQREYLDEGGTPLTPLTPLFYSAVINDDYKVEGTSKDMRHILAYVYNTNTQSGYTETKAYLPYAPGDTRLDEHINQVFEVTRVDCGDYYGEVINESSN